MCVLCVLCILYNLSTSCIIRALYILCTVCRLWGVKPHFSPRHTEIWIWGWPKMGKKVYEKRGKQSFYFQNRKIPIFAHDAPKFEFGDGKNGEKSIWKEREKVFVLTNCCTLLSLFSAF